MPHSDAADTTDLAKRAQESKDGNFWCRKSRCNATSLYAHQFCRFATTAWSTVDKLLVLSPDWLSPACEADYLFVLNDGSLLNKGTITRLLKRRMREQLPWRRADAPAPGAAELAAAVQRVRDGRARRPRRAAPGCEAFRVSLDRGLGRARRTPRGDPVQALPAPQGLQKVAPQHAR